MVILPLLSSVDASDGADARATVAAASCWLADATVRKGARRRARAAIRARRAVGMEWTRAGSDAYEQAGLRGAPRESSRWCARGINEGARAPCKNWSMPLPEPSEPVRVEPMQEPYPPELQAVFDQIMPPGVPPLSLFATLARAPRIFDRLRAGSLLDRGPVPLRQREIVIDRTCGRCGCAYEWGVHVAYFAERAKLTPAQVGATFGGDGDDPAWSNEERLLIQLVDQLHDTSNISAELWQALASAFSVEQILELIALVGFYHTVSFFANGLKLEAESYAVRPPLG